MKNFLKIKDHHILIADEMAAKIHSMSDQEQIEMLEGIRQGLIKRTQNHLINLRKFNKG